MVILAFLPRGVKVVLAAGVLLLLVFRAFGQHAYIRLNQAGYLTADQKIAIVISNKPLTGSFTVARASGNRRVFSGKLNHLPAPDWGGEFGFYYRADFSRVTPNW